MGNEISAGKCQHDSVPQYGLQSTATACLYLMTVVTHPGVGTPKLRHDGKFSGNDPHF